MSSAYEVVAFDATRRDAYLGLLHEAWGGDSMTGEAFDWWFADNPEGSLLSVADIGGRTVGVAGHSLARSVVGGVPSLVQFSVHATTAADARGLGIFRALEVRHEQQGAALGSKAVLAFASAPTRPLFLGPLGWTQIDRVRVWARPRLPLLRRLLRRRSEGGLPSRGGDRRVGGVSVRRVDRFGTDADSAYADAVPLLRNHLVRDARYLNWRYLDSPRGYRALSTASGFAVVGRKVHRGIDTAYIAELLAPPGEASALLSCCLADTRGGPEVVVAVPTPTLPRSLLARAGFVPSSAVLDFMGKGLVEPLDTRGDAWSVTLGDTDFF